MTEEGMYVELTRSPDKDSVQSIPDTITLDILCTVAKNQGWSITSRPDGYWLRTGDGIKYLVKKEICMHDLNTGERRLGFYEEDGGLLNNDNTHALNVVQEIKDMVDWTMDRILY